MAAYNNMYTHVQGTFQQMAGKSPVTYISPKLLRETQGVYRSQYIYGVLKL
jgi:hypothetical protein